MTKNENNEKKKNPSLLSEIAGVTVKQVRNVLSVFDMWTTSAWWFVGVRGFHARE